MKSLILFGFLFVITSCGNKDSSANKKPAVQAPEVLPALPDNSLGVEVMDDEVNRVVALTIPASKRYNPTVFENGWGYVPRSASLILPEHIPVTQGRPGNHLALVTVTVADGVSLKCIYLGQGSNTAAEYSTAAKTYRFDFCVEASVAVTPGTRAALKASADNILDAVVRLSSPIGLKRGDRIEVSVNNSNRNGAANITGEVRPVFDLSY